MLFSCLVSVCHTFDVFVSCVIVVLYVLGSVSLSSCVDNYVVFYVLCVSVSCF